MNCYQYKSARQKHLPIILLGLLLGTICIVQWPGIYGPFVFDSEYNLLQYNILEATNPFSLATFLKQPRYFSILSLWLNWQTTGLEPLWFKLINIFIHLVNTTLVFVLFTFLLDQTHQTASSLLKTTWAWIGAAFYGLNPLVLYATLYDIQRLILLANMFSLMALTIFVFALKHQKTWGYFLAALFYFFAIHSKEHVIMLPVIMLAMVPIFVPITKILIKNLFSPFLFMGLFAIHIALILKNLGGQLYEPNAEGSMAALVTTQEFVLQNDLFLLSILNQCGFFFRYLFLWCVPAIGFMAIDLPTVFPTQAWPIPGLMGFAFGIYTVSTATLLFLKKTRWIGFCLFYPVIMFVPEFFAIRFHEPFVLYRCYIWFWPLGGVLPFILKQINWKTLTVIAVWLGLLVICSLERAYVFSDDVLLWSDAVKKIGQQTKSNPSAYRTFGNLGTALNEKGRYQEAYQAFNNAAKLNPLYAKAWDGIGSALAFQNKHRESLPYFEKAIEVFPEYTNALHNLGTAYSFLGQNEKAIQTLTRSLSLGSNYWMTWYNLGNVHLGQADYDKAEECYHKARILNPLAADVLQNLAYVYLKTNDLTMALKIYKEKLKLLPNDQELIRTIVDLEQKIALSKESQ